jgi:hypothetical protein
MATSRSRLSSCAFHTSPMPPSPMRSRSRYLPRTVPAATVRASVDVVRILAVTGNQVIAGANGLHYLGRSDILES